MGKQNKIPHSIYCIKLMSTLLFAIICSIASTWWTTAHLGENLFSYFIGGVPLLSWLLIALIIYIEDRL